MPLIRLVYFSENQIDPAAGSVIRALSNVLSASNNNNKRDGITGALVFDDQWFIQALEGDRSKVWATFERIKEDERHSNALIAELVDIQQRVFANWWMGLATRNDQTACVFEPHLQNGRLDPRLMTAGAMLKLMNALSRVGLQREVDETQMA